MNQQVDAKKLIASLAYHIGYYRSVIASNTYVLGSPRARIHEKRFTTRDDAIEFAEKVRLVFDRVRSKREVSS